MVQVQTKRRIAKPIGLHIIALFDLVAVGLIPLVTVVLALRNPEVELPFWVVLISVAIPVFVMPAAVWAWVGDNSGRLVLLALVTLMSIVLIVNSLVLFSTGELAGRQSVQIAGVVIRASFWLAINWWYFNRAHVIEFFKQNQ